jgi:hypothetical protein
MSNPMLTSAIPSGVRTPPTEIHGPNGITAIKVSAVVTERIGASRYMGL